MAIDEMKIDPNVLEISRVLIGRYVGKQQDLLRDYHSKIRFLGHSWRDDSGFGEMEKEVERFTKNAIEVLKMINTTYCKFLLDEINDIRNNLQTIGKK